MNETALARAALAETWDTLPEPLRSPAQFLARQNRGCAATIGVMPRCDFYCRGCYLGKEANRMPALPLEALKEQLRQIRRWLGPAGNLQITDGEATLRDEQELIELIAYARQIGLVPMLMTHGETFRSKPGLLERLMTMGGLTEVSIHIDSTMRGRRGGYKDAREESALEGLRDEFANRIRAARKCTGRRLEAASTVTVTRDNLEDIPGVMNWFMNNTDAFKMVSFQPLARVGRTDPDIGSVSVDELWNKIIEGTGNPGLSSGEGMLGHPDCTRFVQGMVSGKGKKRRFTPLYNRFQRDEMELLDGILKRLSGISFRLDSPTVAVCRKISLLLRHGIFLLRRGTPHVLRLMRRARAINGRYFCIVSHHFMNAAELATPIGKERLAVCAFRVPIAGTLEPMCAVNALGLREALYRKQTSHSEQS